MEGEAATGGVRGDEAATGAVQSVDRALRILDLIVDSGSAGIADIARTLGVHRSTAFRLLVTLEGRRYVRREADGSYALGSGAIRMAGAVTDRVDFAREAQLICDEVTDRFGETSNVAILVEGEAVNIAQATGTGSVAVRDQFVGQRTPLHATSSGKVLLAYADDALQVKTGRTLRRFSDSTIVRAQDLREHMRLVRERGWASAVSEWQADTHAVAVPVHAEGRIAAALSITAPAFRMPEAAFADLAAELRGFADTLSRRLGYRVQPGT